MRVSCRPFRPAALAALVLLIIGVFVLAVQPVAAAETTQNASGRYDTLVLRDLGGKQAALVQLIAEEGAFTERELWRSKKGAFDTRKATFVAGDVNGDGIGDGIALYDLGGGRSRLLVYQSDGFAAKQATAWTSKPGRLHEVEGQARRERPRPRRPRRPPRPLRPRPLRRRPLPLPLDRHASSSSRSPSRRAPGSSGPRRSSPPPT